MSKNDPKDPTSWTPDFIAAFNAFRPAYTLPAGTYRALDGKLYRVEPGLPPSLDTRAAEIATLRTRLAAAEAERDELASEAVDRLVLVATLRTRAEQAEAERDVLRDECASISKEFGLPPGIRPAEGEIARMMGRARRTEQAEAEVARLREANLKAALAAGEAVRAIMQTRESALREAAGVCEAYANEWGLMAAVSSRAAGNSYGANECSRRILSLLDAAPAAEVKP